MSNSRIVTMKLEGQKRNMSIARNDFFVCCLLLSVLQPRAEHDHLSSGYIDSPE